jgi:hypothetical protein
LEDSSFSTRNFIDAEEIKVLVDLVLFNHEAANWVSKSDSFRCGSPKHRALNPSQEIDSKSFSKFAPAARHALGGTGGVGSYSNPT